MTFHLTTAETWARQRDQSTYLPDAFAQDGFIHCTDGEQNMVDTANRYYAADPSQFICLVIEQERVASEIRYEDPNRIYPHIYGPLNVNAVIAVRAFERDADGHFTRLGDEISA
jgi:uncharacterized protein (DUF952 family)